MKPLTEYELEQLIGEVSAKCSPQLRNDFYRLLREIQELRDQRAERMLSFDMESNLDG